MKSNLFLVLLGASALFLFSGCATSQNASSSRDQRTLWVYENGSFENRKGKTWIEINPDIKRDVGHITFTETGRTKDHVYLSDSSRNMIVRLSKDQMEWKQGKMGPWKVLYAGSWKR